MEEVLKWRGHKLQGRQYLRSLNISPLWAQLCGIKHTFVLSRTEVRCSLPRACSSLVLLSSAMPSRGISVWCTGGDMVCWCSWEGGVGNILVSSVKQKRQRHAVEAGHRPTHTRTLQYSETYRETTAMRPLSWKRYLRDFAHIHNIDKCKATTTAVQHNRVQWCSLSASILQDLVCFFTG